MNSEIKASPNCNAAILSSDWITYRNHINHKIQHAQTILFTSMLPNHVQTNPSQTKPNDNDKPTFPHPKPPKTRQEQPQTTNGTKPRHGKQRCDAHPPLPQPLERRLLRWGYVEGVVGPLLRRVPRRGAGLIVPVVVEMPGRPRRRRPALLHCARTYEIRTGDDTEVSSRSLTLASAVAYLVNQPSH